jgi:hypothetical protein
MSRWYHSTDRSDTAEMDLKQWRPSELLDSTLLWIVQLERDGNVTGARRGSVRTA